MLFVLKELWSRDFISNGLEGLFSLALVLFEQIMRLHEFNYIFIKLETYYTGLGNGYYKQILTLFEQRINGF